MAGDAGKMHGRFSDIDYIQWLSGEIMGLARHNRAQLGRGPSDDLLTWSGGTICQPTVGGNFDVLFSDHERYLSAILEMLNAESLCANADITIMVQAIVKPKSEAPRG